MSLFILPAAVFTMQAGEGFEHISFDSLTVDLGRISEDGKPAVCCLKWKNMSEKAVSVVMVRTSCHCLVADFSRNAVQPGDSGSIRLTYYQKGHPGKISRKVFVYTRLSADSPSATLTVTGYVEPSKMPVWQYPYSSGGLYLKQAGVCIPGTRLQVERIMCLNAGTVDLTVSAGTDLPDGFSIRTEPEVLHPGQTGDLVISFDPGKAQGKMPKEINAVIVQPGVDSDGQTLKIRINKTAGDTTSEYPVSRRR